MLHKLVLNCSNSVEQYKQQQITITDNGSMCQGWILLIMKPEFSLKSGPCLHVQFNNIIYFVINMYIVIRAS